MSTLTSDVRAKRREQLRAFKKMATEPKSALIRLHSELSNLNQREADRLGRIIARLEGWQNS